METNPWKNEIMNKWRWTLIDPKTMDIESDQDEDLIIIMSDIQDIINHLKKSNERF